MIALRGVTRSFGSVRALDDVSLDVARGTTHVLLGSSGSGKSTILRLILGLAVPQAGEVEVAGIVVSEATRAAVAQQVGYVVQEGALYPHLTGFANVALPAQVRGWSRTRIEARVQALAQMVGLTLATLGHHPAQLSGGERQRVGLMRALMLDPPVLLLDEPLGALDPIVRAGLQAELARLFRELGKTVLLVTHDVREAMALGASVTLLTAGRVVQHGTFADLVRRPASPFVTEFLSAQATPAIAEDGG
jgi:osmoprotectant transport system ATP-binding protein